VFLHEQETLIIKGTRCRPPMKKKPTLVGHGLPMIVTHAQAMLAHMVLPLIEETEKEVL
jgi:hypothetical protein